MYRLLTTVWKDSCPSSNSSASGIALAAAAAAEGAARGRLGVAPFLFDKDNLCGLEAGAGAIAEAACTEAASG